jgi:hypothetical protein
MFLQELNDHENIIRRARGALLRRDSRPWRPLCACSPAPPRREARAVGFPRSFLAVGRGPSDRAVRRGSAAAASAN